MTDGPGAVVVKVSKSGHDMRFDIPIVGERTMKKLKKIKASALAVEAGRTILLERERIVEAANRQGLCLMAVDVQTDPADASELPEGDHGDKTS